MHWKKVIDLDKAVKARQHVVRVESQKICLWYHQDTWFAFDLRCPHEGYPLSQGDVDDNCVLTCRWHNWRFRLSDGVALRGEDRLNTYPVRMGDQALWVDFSKPSKSVRRQQLIDDMKPMFTRRYYGAMGRLWTKWAANGFPAQVMHAQAFSWSYTRLERGFSHAIAGLGEWMTLAERFDDPAKQLSCHLEAMDFLAEETFGEPNYPFAEGDQPFEANAFLLALEKEDEPSAVRMLNHLAKDGPIFPILEPHLVTFAHDHYLGYGHGVIYLSKIPDLVAKLGPSSELGLLKTYIRYACVAVRDEMLPEFKNYHSVLAQVQTHLANLPTKTKAPLHPPLGATLQQIWAWLLDASKDHSPQAIFQELIHAAARNLLHFDEAVQLKVDLQPKDTFSWLSLSHGLTFAEAAHGFVQRYPEVLPAVLVQLAAFIGRVQKAIDPDFNPSPWLVKDSTSFTNWAYEHLLSAGETENIYPVHWLKTLLAVEKLNTWVAPQVAETLLASLNRYMHAPIFKKSPERTIRQAQALLSPAEVSEV